MKMREASTKMIYDVQSLFYDVTFARLVRKRIERAIEHVDIRAGNLVLDLGIGTGSALDYYPHEGQIVGVDLSSGMLRECAKRIQQQNRTNVRILQANALQLPFADDTFDRVFISHVITVVSEPGIVIREAQRVAKRGARIVLVNHFQNPNPAIATIEKWLCPICTKLGWRSDLALQDLVRATGMQIDYRFKLDCLDLWETVVVSNDKSAVTVPAVAP